MKIKTVRNSPRLKLVMAIILVSMMQSCIRKEDMDFSKMAESNWNPNFSMPLIHSKLSISNLLPQNDTIAAGLDSLSSVTLVYKGAIYSMCGYQFLPMLDQTNNQTVNLSAPEIITLASADSVIANRNILYSLGVSNSERIDSMMLGHGMLNIGISSAIRHGGVLSVTIPTARLNGVSFSKEITFTYANQVPVVAAGNFDLTGYDFDLSSTGSYNLLPIQYSVKFFDSSNPTLTTETFSVNASYQNMIIKKAFGDFGSRNITVQDDSTRLEIFNNVNFGNLSFDNPNVQFSISNSFGMVVDAHFSSLYSQSAINGSTNITGFPNPVPVNSPTTTGATAYSSFTLDHTNSNIRDAINQDPQFLGYHVTAALNPQTSSFSFLEDSSKFNVDVRVELPLTGVAQGLVIQDTVDFTIAEIQEIESAKFRINITNGYPLDVTTQLYFVDSSFTVLDSLITLPNEAIRAGLIDPATGIVNHPTLKTSNEYFSKIRMRNIYDAKKILVHGIINTPTAPNVSVRFYPDYILDVRLAVQAQLKINIQ